MQTKYLILILGLLIVILAHGDRGRKAGGSGRYIKSILGIENGSGRRIKGYDYIRVLAVIAVIGTHVVQSDTQLSAGSPGWIGLRIAETAFLTCNVLFVMLSGALLLNRGEEPVASFYRKRVFRVVIPMAVYYMFYLYMGLYHSGLFNPANWLDAGRRFLSGPSDWNPHFWLMYVIISFYLTAPFFRVMVQNMSDRLLTSFVFLTFVMNGALAWLPLAGIQFSFVTVLCGWESVFVFGYFWTRPVSKRFFKPFMALGAVSFVFTAAASCIAPDGAEMLFNKAPSMLFMAGGIFAWFSEREDHLKMPGMAVRVIGKYGFSILLIHWYILHYVTEERLGLYASSFGVIGGTALAMAVTLILSLLAALVFDNTVVIAVEYVCEAALKWLEKIWKRLTRRSAS